MFERVAMHDHACVVYPDQEGLLSMLDGFTAAGIDAGRVTLFVHSFPSDDEALRFLDAGGVEYEELLGKTFFLVSHYVPAFQGDGDRIDHDHVARTVTGLTETAQRMERELGIFVDASHRYLDEARTNEWFEFEEWLGLRLQQEAALICAYRDDHANDPATRARILQTHLYRFG